MQGSRNEPAEGLVPVNAVAVTEETAPRELAGVLDDGVRGAHARAHDPTQLA
jgi:hypothetical protein